MQQNDQEQAAEVAAEDNKIKDLNLVINYLAEQFPECFTEKGDAKPLKIGIFKDLVERLNDDEKVSRTVLRSALRRYTSSWRYLESIKEGASRVDLDGNAVAELEKEHIEHAQEELAKSKQAAAERRKQQNAKKRPAAKKPVGDKGDKKAKSNFKKPAKKSASSASVKVKKRRNIDVGLYEGKLVKVQADDATAPVAATVKEINDDQVVLQTFGGVVMTTEKKNIIE
ncbi:RNA chaperone ProQ [Catenovulum sp. SM1970]|uniref:RNA chaperone ProQ n=1 Tax=Marinifaba aquimaris TaxID=2741323 RepID=UPI001571B7FF|nr:RNA chaperone ProQ [Marinifaba aquimaris]NTS76066.1 RNA chaperone ProQ [Marinifaba aquimaris]